MHHFLENDRIYCRFDMFQIIIQPLLPLYWPHCWVSTDSDAPLLIFEHCIPKHPHTLHTPFQRTCLPPHIMHREIKARQTWKVAGQKLELKKREEEKRKNGRSLSCGALPLKASWPAICAGSLAIATTPGRERGERQQARGSQGKREGGKDGGKEGETDWEHERWKKWVRNWGSNKWKIRSQRRA